MRICADLGRNLGTGKGEPDRPHRRRRAETLSRLPRRDEARTHHFAVDAGIAAAPGTPPAWVIICTALDGRTFGAGEAHPEHPHRLRRTATLSPLTRRGGGELTDRPAVDTGIGAAGATPRPNHGDPRMMRPAIPVSDLSPAQSGPAPRRCHRRGPR